VNEPSDYAANNTLSTPRSDKRLSLPINFIAALTESLSPTKSRRTESIDDHDRPDSRRLSSAAERPFIIRPSSPPAPTSQPSSPIGVVVPNDTANHMKDTQTEERKLIDVQGILEDTPMFRQQIKTAETVSCYTVT
jgi:hypothetical protein